MRRRWFLAAFLMLGSVCVEASNLSQIPTILQIRRVYSFFRKHRCPAAAFAREFVTIAHRFSLDWRLLPALAFVESTGGKHVFAAHNWFGWGSGNVSFPTVTDAILTVAHHLAEDMRYRGKNLRERLHVYNHHADYPSKVLSVMSQI